jgi:uncharacterized protein YgiM (DUF1202 family)
MQTRAILIAAALVLLFAASPTPVHAEILRTRRDTTLRARPGESQRAVARLQADQEVEVITRAGRWLRVRSGERVGWLTRTNVRDDAPEKRAQRKTRVESWRRDQPEPAIPRARKDIVTVRVNNGTQDTFRAPSGTTRVAFRARSADVLTVVGDNQDRTWLLVENEHGQVGWVPAVITTPVAMTQATRDRRAALLATALAESSEAVDTPIALVTRHARAAVGYRIMATRFTSNGSAELANYRISAQAMTATLDGSLPLTSSSSRFLAAVEGEYRLSLASPGIHYQDGAGKLDTIAFSMHEVRAGGQLGVRVTDSALVAGRVGYHYGLFLVDALENRAGLANESLHGLTVGGRAHLTPGKGSCAIRAGFDVLAGARRGQSAGLEDGAGSAASAWWGHLGMDYALTAGLMLSAHYAYERAGTEWTGQSARQPDVTEAARTDQSHLVYMGLGKTF